MAEEEVREQVPTEVEDRPHVPGPYDTTPENPLRITVNPNPPFKTEPVDYDPFAPLTTSPVETSPQGAPAGVGAEQGTEPAPPDSPSIAQAPPDLAVPLATEAVDYNPFAAPTTAGRGRGELGRTVATVGGYAPDIDYKTGAPFWARVMLQRASNPNEAKLALEKLYGPGNSGQDERGRWWINTPDANGTPHKIAVMPSGSIGSAFANMGAGMAASATPMAGAIAGGSAGAMMTPIAPPVGAAVGAGVGAAGGYALDQLVKYHQNLFDQSPGEFATHTKNEALLNTALTAGVPIAGKVIGGITSAAREWLGTTPTTRSMTERLVNAGARPPIKSVAPNFRSFSDKQMLRNVVMGDPGEAQNVSYITQRMTDALRSSGMDEAGIARLMGEVANPLEATSAAPAGRAMATEVQTRVGADAASAQASRLAAENSLHAMQTTLRNYADAPVGRMGQDVADAIIANRREFSRASRAAYGNVHDMAGGQPVIDLADTFGRSQHFVDLAEPGLVPAYISRLAARGNQVRAAQQEVATLMGAGEQVPAELQAAANGNMVSLAEAHEIRTNLRELVGHDVDLTRSPYLGKIMDVGHALDGTITRLANSGELGGEAARELRAVDTMYRRGIARYYDSQINKLVRDVRSGLIPDAEQVASTIIKEGRTESANEILRMVSPELRESIARVDLRNMLADSSHRGRDGIITLDGMKFLDILDQRVGINGLYTPQQMGAMRQLASEYAALDGKLDVTRLPVSQVTHAISDYINRTHQIDEFVRGNPMGALISGRPEVVDRATHIVAQPGNEASTVEAARYFGVNSPQWNQIQTNALRDLMRTAFATTQSRVLSISGPNIERALRKYTAAQQELLFPGGLVEDLKEIAQEARFLFPRGFGPGGSDLAISQSARTITLHTGVFVANPQTLRADMRWIGTGLMGYITDRPAVLKFLAGTARKDPGAARKILGVLGRWYVNEEAMGPGRDRPKAQPPTP